MRTAIHHRREPTPAVATAEAVTARQAAAQLAARPAPVHDISGVAIAEVAQRKPMPGANGNADRAAVRTGLPDRLKSGVEALSGLSMDAIRVHRNSPEPARLQAHAYTKGAETHLAPGQERHLPHEAWHVVQQAQGRVRPTMQLGPGMSVNDDRSLEREADTMGGRALQCAAAPAARLPRPRYPPVLQAYRSRQVSEEGVGTGTDLHSQSPEPAILPGPGPATLAYAQQQTVSGSSWFRVADDTSMAVPETTDEPKEFFAKNAVFNNANGTLTAIGSPLRLRKAGGQARFGTTTLAKIVPMRADGADGPGFASLWSHICIELTNHIMANSGRQTEDVVLQSGEHEGSATITAGGLRSAAIDRLAAHLSDAAPQPADPQAALGAALGAIRPEEPDQRPGQQYGRASAGGGVTAKARKLGVNEFARPEIGEGFATFSIFPQGGGAFDYTTGRRQKRQGIWGYHHAAVVARSLDHNDWMTLENYNRTPQAEDKAYAVLRRKYARVAKKKWAELKRGGATDEAAKTGLQDYLTAEHEGARQEYNAIFQRSQLPAGRLWFFRMYGSGRGQSFHEQQAATRGYVNPLTVRVRRNVVGQRSQQLVVTERTILASIAAEQINWRGARAGLDTLQAATRVAFTAMRQVLDGIAARRTDDELADGVRQVNTLYTTWLTNSFVPAMATAMRAVKRGGLDARPPTTLGALKREANAAEAPGRLSGAGDLWYDWSYFSHNTSADRTTSLTNLRSAINAVPARAV